MLAAARRRVPAGSCCLGTFFVKEFPAAWLYSWKSVLWVSANHGSLNLGLIVPAEVKHEINFSIDLQQIIRVGNQKKRVWAVCRIWQYGLWSFQMGDTKLERFLPKNQHAQRKLLNFEFWINCELSKIGHHFSNKIF